MLSDVILTRGIDEGTIVSGVEHAIVYHSPTGFEWGYGGSGPAELALNILAQHMSKKAAWDLHQVFKWQVIAKQPYEGGIIPRTFIEEWITQNRIVSYNEDDPDNVITEIEDFGTPGEP